MATLRIPMTNDLGHTFRTTIGGKSATFYVHWNELDRFWYLSMDVDGVRVVTGRRVVTRGNLLVAQDGLPGVLFAQPLQAEALEEPGRTAWDSSHSLVYLEA